jgi:hypothetical protein
MSQSVQMTFTLPKGPSAVGQGFSRAYAREQA